jgi:uroporphyrinogen decarboxylase
VQRTPSCLAKLDRMRKSLAHEEGDRVPVSDFFWGSFLRRWREELGLAKDADIYRYYDLDWQVTLPNMDPRIRAFEIIRESEDEVVVRTGFGAVLCKKFDQAMPGFLSFETATLEMLEQLQFDDPWDERRFFRAGDNQLAGVGDGFERNSPAWTETVRRLHPDFPVFGSVCEAHEMLWRITGNENLLLWMGEAPERLARQVERVGRFCVELARAQIRAADGLLDGMVIWGDVAYCKSMLFSPAYWRRWFKPVVRELCAVCRDAGIPVIYHGCGNARRIFEDLIECGIDAYNPLEAKAGLDVVELRREFGHRLGFCGNMDARAWADAPLEELTAAVLRKLNAARGGGYIFQSDHSVPGNVSAARYEHVLDLVRRYGLYPLDLGEHTIAGLG